jgi:hypothetical protein
MNLLRVYVVVLMAGWLVWLALDKPPSAQYGPAGGMVPPSSVQPFPLPPHERRTRYPAMQPPPEGDTLADFQYAADRVKRGELREGFVVLWRRQYLWVAAIVTALVTIVLAPAFRAVAQRRWRGHRTGGRPSKGEGRSTETDS